jgi:hypothetical protein
MTTAAAIDRARDIAAALGGRRAQRLAGGGWLVSCPVPSHGKGNGDRNPSLEISDGDRQLLVRCYGGCDPRDVLDELRRRGLLPSRPSPRPAKAKETLEFSATDHEREQHRKAAWLWSHRQPIIGSIAERYLRHARGITCPLPPTLAFLPPGKPGQHPAMIAAFGLVGEIEPGVLAEPNAVGAVHLTLLRADGSGKADTSPNKIMIGRSLGLPITLAPPNDLLGLTVSEGIEDALAAHQSTGLGAWAAGSAGRMGALADTIPGIECVTIFAHADPAGQRGAQALAEALMRRRIEVLIEGLA